jgi:hypothetical protein
MNSKRIQINISVKSMRIQNKEINEIKKTRFEGGV